MEEAMNKEMSERQQNVMHVIKATYQDDPEQIEALIEELKRLKNEQKHAEREERLEPKTMINSDEAADTSSSIEMDHAQSSSGKDVLNFLLGSTKSTVSNIRGHAGQNDEPVIIHTIENDSVEVSKDEENSGFADLPELESFDQELQSDESSIEDEDDYESDESYSALSNKKVTVENAFDFLSEDEDNDEDNLAVTESDIGCNKPAKKKRQRNKKKQMQNSEIDASLLIDSEKKESGLKFEGLKSPKTLIESPRFNMYGPETFFFSPVLITYTIVLVMITAVASAFLFRGSSVSISQLPSIPYEAPFDEAVNASVHFIQPLNRSILTEPIFQWEIRNVTPAMEAIARVVHLIVSVDKKEVHSEYTMIPKNLPSTFMTLNMKGLSDGPHTASIRLTIPLKGGEEWMIYEESVFEFRSAEPYARIKVEPKHDCLHLNESVSAHFVGNSISLSYDTSAGITKAGEKASQFFAMGDQRFELLPKLGQFNINGANVGQHMLYIRVYDANGTKLAESHAIVYVFEKSPMGHGNMAELAAKHNIRYIPTFQEMMKAA